MQRVLSYLAIVVVAIAASYGVSRYVTSALQAHRYDVCRNENRIVARLNSHTVANQNRIVTILEHFTADAAKARMATYETSHHRSDLVAAQQYSEQHRDLFRLHVPRYDPLNCQTNA